jgi:hypothetical protein
MFSPVSVHQELAEKQKPPTHQGGGFIPPAEILFGEFPHHTSSGTFVPDQGHLSSPLPGCQTRFRVIPDVGSDRINLGTRCNKILCHSKIQPPPRASSCKLAEFFGLKRNLVILLIAIFVIGAGEELWMRLCRSICKQSARLFLSSVFTMRCALCSARSTRIPADYWSIFGDIGARFSRSICYLSLVTHSCCSFRTGAQ